jgi:hypothetical protein
LLGSTWIDLDHVQALEPSETVCAVKITFAFRNEPAWVDYAGSYKEWLAFLAARKNVTPVT